MWWMVAAAFAGVPEGVNVEQVDLWDDRANALQDGPDGCYEVVGRTTWDWDLGRHGGSQGNAAFMARYEDGIWLDVYTRSLGEDTWERRDLPVRVFPHGEVRFVPLVGRLADHYGSYGEEGVAENLSQSLIDQFSQGVSYAFVEWDDAAQEVRVQRVVPFGTGAEAVQVAHFPEGGALPTRLDTTVDTSVAIPGFRGAKVRHAEAHVLGVAVGEQVFPTTEAFQVSASAFGARIEGAQTVRYLTWRRCGAAVDDEIRALGD
jgi:hypothetical protein